MSYFLIKKLIDSLNEQIDNAAPSEPLTPAQFAARMKVAILWMLGLILTTLVILWVTQ